MKTYEEAKYFTNVHTSDNIIKRRGVIFIMKNIITKKMLSKFELFLHEDEKSKTTIDKYLRDIRFFTEYANGRSVDKKMVINYKSYIGEKYAVASANSMIAAINAFFRFAGWNDCCVKQFKIQKRTFCTEEKELNKAEYLALIRAAEKKSNERLSLLIQTICGTGIRVSELVNITVEAVCKGEAVVSCKGKTRRIFIVSALRRKLLAFAYKRGIRSGMIFVTKKGKALNRSNVWSEMKKLCKDAGVLPDKVFPHNLRHLFARTFYAVEKDIAKLADILGHSNINTTRIYIISTGEEHRQKMEKMRLII